MPENNPLKYENGRYCIPKCFCDTTYSNQCSTPSRHQSYSNFKNDTCDGINEFHGIITTVYQPSKDNTNTLQLEINPHEKSCLLKNFPLVVQNLILPIEHTHCLILPIEHSHYLKKT